MRNIRIIATLTFTMLLSLEVLGQTSEEDLALSYGSEEFLSIATGQTQLISEAPAVASVITAKDIEAIGATDLDEVLETVPGLHVSINEFYNPIYTIRGVYSKFNPQVLILVNGIPITNLYLGNRGLVWSGMPLAAVERIEIIRGPDSAVYGADAFAGTINIITKTNHSHPNAEMGFRFGSHDTNAVWLLYNNNFGKVDAAFSLELGTTDGHDEVITFDQQIILDTIDNTNASLAPHPVSLSQDNTDIRVDITNNEHWRLRAGLQKRSNVGTGAGVAEALDPHGKFKSERRNVDLTYQNSNTFENWIFESQLSYFYTTQEVDKNLLLFPPASELGQNGASYPNGVIGNPEVFENHTRFSLSSFFHGFDRHSIRLSTGIHQAELSKVKESKNFGLDGEGNPIIPGDPIVSVDDTPYIFLPEDDRNNAYIFLQDVWKFINDWELTAGIRYDNYSDFGSTTNPRLALIWSTTHNLTTKFLYGKAFRAPSFAETRNQNNPIALGNPDLHPEEIETFEIAFDYKPRYNTRLRANLFTYTWKGIIDFIQDSGPATTTAQNSGKQTGKGIEVEMELSLTEAVRLMTNYAFQDSIDNETGANAPNSPKHQFYLRTDWQISNSYKLSSYINWIGDRHRPYGDIRPKIDDYKIISSVLTYRKSGAPWKLRLAIKNVLDEAAFEPRPSTILPSDFPLAKRSYFLDIEYVF